MFSEQTDILMADGSYRWIDLIEPGMLVAQGDGDTAEVVEIRTSTPGTKTAIMLNGVATVHDQTVMLANGWSSLDPVNTPTDVFDPPSDNEPHYITMQPGYQIATLNGMHDIDIVGIGMLPDATLYTLVLRRSGNCVVGPNKVIFGAIRSA
jgi:hypothetical protein